MTRLGSSLACALVFLCGQSQAAAEPQALTADAGQLSASIQWIDVPGKRDTVYMAQRTSNGQLILTPNEGFFPQRGLTAAGAGIAPDVGKLNGGKSYGHIVGWDRGERTEWGLWFENRGKLDVEVRMSGSLAGDRFSVGLGDGVAQEFKARTSVHLQLDVPAAGFHVLRVENVSANKTRARLRWLRLSGGPVANGAVLRKRWRPAAAHTRFSSSTVRGDVRLWVMEMDALPGTLGFYSPITTPFGYYGPTWNADGTVNSGFNFSLWSYGRGKQAPPIEQLSHLTAIGNPEARFSGFGHEGTGVKIRGWEPLKGRQGQRQAIALRVEPGTTYDTYFSYFYATDEKRWRLFGAGRKFNKGRPLKSLWVGSFVEVPGPPPRQRTGPYVRQMRYRGWVMDAAGCWSPLNRMRHGNADKKTGRTHTGRGLTADGRFYLETGGWEFRKAPAAGYVLAQSGSDAPLPAFMQPQALEPLLRVPSGIDSVKAERQGTRTTVSFRLRNAGSSPAVTVYWGDTEGLTFADLWDEKTQVASPKEGANQMMITRADGTRPLFIRVLLKNDEGLFWSDETLVVR